MPPSQTRPRLTASNPRCNAATSRPNQVLQSNSNLPRSSQQSSTLCPASHPPIRKNPKLLWGNADALSAVSKAAAARGPDNSSASGFEALACSPGCPWLRPLRHGLGDGGRGYRTWSRDGGWRRAPGERLRSTPNGGTSRSTHSTFRTLGLTTTAKSCPRVVTKAPVEISAAFNARFGCAAHRRTRQLTATPVQTDTVWRDLHPSQSPSHPQRRPPSVAQQTGGLLPLRDRWS